MRVDSVSDRTFLMHKGGKIEITSKLTIKSNTVAIVSDGTAVLGLGDIGPEAAMPLEAHVATVAASSVVVPAEGSQSRPAANVL